MDQLSLPLFGWQLEFMSSHFSTLSKSWSILHLSITLTIWQAKACLLPCQFARSFLLVTHTILVCYLSQASRKMLREKPKIPLNVDEEKKSRRLQELKRLSGRPGPRGAVGVIWVSWAVSSCVIWKGLPNNKKGVTVSLLFIIQAPVILNNDSDEIFHWGGLYLEV